MAIDELSYRFKPRMSENGRYSAPERMTPSPVKAPRVPSRQSLAKAKWWADKRTAEAKAAGQGKLQPIATMPTDGTPFYVWLPRYSNSPLVYTAWCGFFQNEFLNGGVSNRDAFKPEYWLPVPSGPEV